MMKLKNFMIVVILIAYARGMPQLTKKNVSEENQPLTNGISINDISADAITIVRERRSASPVGDSYDGSHRGPPSWHNGKDGAPFVPHHRAAQPSQVTRGRRSASPIGDFYDGSHRGQPSWFDRRDGAPFVPHHKAPQPSQVSMYDGSHRSSPYPMRSNNGSHRSAPSRYTRSPFSPRYSGSHRSAPTRYDGSHRSAPVYWGARGPRNQGTGGSGVIVYG